MPETGSLTPVQSFIQRFDTTSGEGGVITAPEVTTDFVTDFVDETTDSRAQIYLQLSATAKMRLITILAAVSSPSYLQAIADIYLCSTPHERDLINMQIGESIRSSMNCRLRHLAAYGTGRERILATVVLQAVFTIENGSCALREGDLANGRGGCTMEYTPIGGTSRERVVVMGPEHQSCIVRGAGLKTVL